MFQLLPKLVVERYCSVGRNPGAIFRANGRPSAVGPTNQVKTLVGVAPQQVQGGLIFATLFVEQFEFADGLLRTQSWRQGGGHVGSADGYDLNLEWRITHGIVNMVKADFPGLVREAEWVSTSFRAIWLAM